MDLLIRNLEPEIIQRLKLRAKRHHRSLQRELKCIVEAATKVSMAEARKITAAWRKRLAGGSFTDSATAIRKDRKR